MNLKVGRALLSSRLVPIRTLLVPDAACTGVPAPPSPGGSPLHRRNPHPLLIVAQPQPRGSRYAPIPEPEPNSLPTTSRPPSGPLQAYYWPTSSQPLGNPPPMGTVYPPAGGP